MAFDEGPAFEEPGDSYQQDFTVSWTGLVSRTFTLWTRKLIPYIMIALFPILIFTLLEVAVIYIIFGPSGLFLIGGIASDPLSLILNLVFISGDLLTITVSIALAIVSIIITTLVAGATYKFALDNYGAPDQGDVGESYSFAFGRLVPLIVVQLLISVIAIAMVAPGSFFLFIGLITLDISSLMIGIGALLIGLLLSLYVSVRLSVAGILVIAEDQSAIDALKKSFALTSGQFWHIFAGQLLLGLLVGVLGIVVGLLSLPLTLIFGATLIGAIISIVIIGILSGALFTPMSYIFSAVLYRDLSSRSTVTQQEWW